MPNRNYIEVQLQNPNKYDAWHYGTGGHLFNERVNIPVDVSIVRGHPKGQPPKRLIPQALRFPIENYKVSDVKRWLKENKVGYKNIELSRKGEVLEYKKLGIFEAFYSLRRELEQEVVKKFGKNSYLADFSDKEAIIGFTNDSDQGSSYQTSVYQRVSYKIDKGIITFTGTAKEVERKTVYEGIEIDGYVWATLALNEKFLQDQNKEE